MIEKLIVLEDIDPVIFYGVNNANMQLIKALYPKLRIVARGNVIKVLGDEEEMCAFEENITKLEKYCAEYNSLKEEVIIDIVKGNAPQAEKSGNVIVFSVTGKPIIPRSENQLKLVEAFSRNDMVFAIGPAGSGKTYTAIALAVRALKNKEIKKIILSRPAVEAGEKLGFLPGDMKDKIDPYLQPLYDALQDMVPAAKLKEYMELNIIQIAPLAFMRGRTLNDAVVILDEAQNTTIIARSYIVGMPNGRFFFLSFFSIYTLRRGRARYPLSVSDRTAFIFFAGVFQRTPSTPGVLRPSLVTTRLTASALA